MLTIVECPCDKCTTKDAITGRVIHRQIDQKLSTRHVRDYGLSQLKENEHPMLNIENDNGESWLLKAIIHMVC